MKREIRVSRILTQWQQCYIEIECDEQGNALDSDTSIYNQAEEDDDNWETYTEGSDNMGWEFLNEVWEDLEDQEEDEEDEREASGDDE